MAEQLNIKEWKETVLFPALFPRIGEIFPEMKFRLSSGKWVSDYHVNGNKSKGANLQSYVTKRYCVQDYNGDPAISLVDLYMRDHGINDVITAFKELAAKCNVEFPESPRDVEAARRNEEIQRNRQQAQRAFISALWNPQDPEALRTLDYLRNVRRWTDEEIRNGGLGFVSEAVLASLPDSAKYYTDENGDRRRVYRSGIGTTHKLVITYWNGSRIFGFKFRNIDHKKEDTEPKYYNTTGLTKREGLFGMPVGCQDVTIVEGELDALHATVKGAKNVVATTGGAVTEEQVQDAIRRGCKRFTLLFDEDAKGQEFTEASATIIKNQGGEPWIASLYGAAKDTDEYLQTHSVEQWDELRQAAAPFSVWQLRKLYSKYDEIIATTGGGLYPKERADFMDGAISVVNSASPQDREMLFSVLGERAQQYVYTVEDVRAWMDEEYTRKEAGQRAQKARVASTKIQDQLRAGNVTEALKIMRDTVTELDVEERATEFSKVFAPPTSTDYKQLFARVKDGVPTGYTFRKYSGDFNEVELKLNPGLTFICAYRGHGKTAFLNNIAVNVARMNVTEGLGGKILYFSYEIDKARLISSLLNVFTNDPEASRNPATSIVSYLKGKGDYFERTRRADGLTHRQYFEKKEQEFRTKYLYTGAITIVEENYKIEKLIMAIRYYLKQEPNVTCILIDYAQLLYSEEYSRLRTEEIKKVVNDLKNLANKEQIPIVLAAQFNRDVFSPASVDTTNIGEGGDFERIADTVIGLYNLKELHPLPGRHEEEKDAIHILKELLPDFSGELRAIDNKLFARLLKRRYEYFPIDVVFDWTGRTTYIAPNKPEMLETEDKRQTQITFEEGPDVIALPAVEEIGDTIADEDLPF